MYFSSFPQRMVNSFRIGLGGRMGRKLFFLHLPKCGGTSIDEAFRSCYKTVDVRNDRFLPRHDSMAAAKAANILYGMNYREGDTNDITFLEFGVANLAYLMSQKKNKYISGHICFDERVCGQYDEEYDFITMLRDPVKRWVSFYLYVRYRNSDRFVTDLPIEKYIKTEIGRSQGHQYVKYLGGIRNDNNYRVQEAINNAKENLRKFRIVGCLEDLDRFIARFQREYGRKLEISFRNRSPAPEALQSKNLSKEILTEIADICAPDIEIYNHLRKHEADHCDVLGK